VYTDNRSQPYVEQQIASCAKQIDWQPEQTEVKVISNQR